MGYGVEVEISGVVILGKNVPRALADLKELMETASKVGGGSSVSGGVVQRHFSWVDTDVVLRAIEQGDLVLALAEWRYSASGQSTVPSPVEAFTAGITGAAVYPDVTVDYFEGGKFGDDCELWETIGEYVERGAHIIWRGEDGYLWRFEFAENCSSFREFTGRIVWEDSYGDPL
jgi:hypothetical protein